MASAQVGGFVGGVVRAIIGGIMTFIGGRGLLGMLPTILHPSFWRSMEESLRLLSFYLVPLVFSLTFFLVGLPLLITGIRRVVGIVRANRDAIQGAVDVVTSGNQPISERLSKLYDHTVNTIDERLSGAWGGSADDAAGARAQQVPHQGAWHPGPGSQRTLQGVQQRPAQQRPPQHPQRQAQAAPRPAQAQASRPSYGQVQNPVQNPSYGQAPRPHQPPHARPPQQPAPQQPAPAQRRDEAQQAVSGQTMRRVQELRRQLDDRVRGARDAAAAVAPQVVSAQEDRSYAARAAEISASLEKAAAAHSQPSSYVDDQEASPKRRSSSSALSSSSLSSPSLSRSSLTSSALQSSLSSRSLFRRR